MSIEIRDFLTSNSNWVSDNFQDFKCLLCNELMIDPSYTPCYCEFCNKCITDYLSNGNCLCPGVTQQCSSISITVDDVILNPSITNRIFKLKLNCPNNDCTYTDVISNVMHHVSICDNYKVQCPLFDHGCCSELNNSKELSKHMRDELENHINISVSLIKQLKIQITQMDMERRHFDNDIKEIKEKLKVYDLKIKNQDKIISGMKHKVKEEKETIYLSNEEENLSSEIHWTNICPYSWIVRNWQSKMDRFKEVNQLISPGFYSSLGKYKFRIGIILSCKYFHFFAQIMQGKYDANLAWPCTTNIQISIINQVTAGIHKNVVIHFKEPNSNEKPNDAGNSIVYSNEAITFDELDKNPLVKQYDNLVIICREIDIVNRMVKEYSTKCQIRRRTYFSLSPNQR